MIDWLDALIGLGIGMTLGVIAALLWSLSRRGARDHEFANLRARTELLTEQAGQHTEEIAVERTAREEAHARREVAELELATLKEQLKSRQQQFQEQHELLDEAKLKLGESFKAAGAEALAQNNKQFLELAKRVLETQMTVAKGDIEKKQLAIEHLVKPIKELLEK